MTKKAVLVGCNYPKTKAELHGCINDVWKMHRSLVGRFGFNEENITVLIDTDRTYMQPTGRNIRRAIMNMISVAEPGDVLFVHYSGHGTRLPAESGSNDDTGYDECIVPCDMNLMTDDDFREIAEKVPIGVTLTIVSDSCHSGGLIDNSKEQIGESFQHSGKKKTRDIGFKELISEGAGGGGLREIVSQGVHASLESHGIHLPSFHHGHHCHGNSYHRYHEEDQRYQHVEYSGVGGVRSRSLPLSVLLDILRQKTGKNDIDVGTIRPTLFDMFGEESSLKVKKFVKALIQGMQGGDTGENGGGVHGVVNSLAQQFLKHKLDVNNNSYEYVKPALDTPTSASQVELAGGKPYSSSQRVTTDMGILISGCQSSETSADANPTGNSSQAYGAMSNAIQTILAEHCDPITNHELVSRAQQLLQKQGFSQHPGLYCSDQNATSLFIC
eukprot:c24423_g2_i1 orf=358-1683(-)